MNLKYIYFVSLEIPLTTLAKTSRRCKNSEEIVILVIISTNSIETFDTYTALKSVRKSATEQLNLIMVQENRINLIHKAKSLSKQNVLIMVTRTSKIVRSSRCYDTHTGMVISRSGLLIALDRYSSLLSFWCIFSQ